MLLTIPGTETNVTPEREVPIIPMATITHGDCLFPKKKASFPLFFLPVIQAIRSSTAKYKISISRIIELFIYNKFPAKII